MTMKSTLLLIYFSAVHVIAFTPSSSSGKRQLRLISRAIPNGLITGNKDVVPDIVVVNDSTALPYNSVLVGQTTASIALNQYPSREQRSMKKMFDPNLRTWKRRLDTHEDPFNVHKWAGLGWLLSSTLIFGCGAFYGFTEVPAILEPITYVFVLSTLAQSATSIPMAIKHRANEPAIQHGFISSAITSTSTALAGFWLGPYGDHNYFGSHLFTLPDIGFVLVAIVMTADSVYSMNAFGEMKEMFLKINEMDPIKDASAILEKIIGMIAKLVGLPLNVAMLQQLWMHASDARAEFLDILVARGSSSELLFYSLMITSITVCIGNLTVTLNHRKLISDRMNNAAIATSAITTAVVNILAAGVDVSEII
jgi:hypothetical protein